MAEERTPETSPAPKGVRGWLAWWFMRLQAGTRPCMSWQIEPERRAEIEADGDDLKSG